MNKNHTNNYGYGCGIRIVVKSAPKAMERPLWEVSRAPDHTWGSGEAPGHFCGDLLDGMACKGQRRQRGGRAGWKRLRP